MGIAMQFALLMAIIAPQQARLAHTGEVLRLEAADFGALARAAQRAQPTATCHGGRQLPHCRTAALPHCHLPPRHCADLHRSASL